MKAASSARAFVEGGVADVDLVALLEQDNPLHRPATGLQRCNAGGSDCRHGKVARPRSVGDRLDLGGAKTVDG